MIMFVCSDDNFKVVEIVWVFDGLKDSGSDLYLRMLVSWCVVVVVNGGFLLLIWVWLLGIVFWICGVLIICEFRVNVVWVLIWVVV